MICNCLLMYSRDIRRCLSGTWALHRTVTWSGSHLFAIKQAVPSSIATPLSSTGNGIRKCSVSFKKPPQQKFTRKLHENAQNGRLTISSGYIHFQNCCHCNVWMNSELKQQSKSYIIMNWDPVRASIFLCISISNFPPKFRTISRSINLLFPFSYCLVVFFFSHRSFHIDLILGCVTRF
jgi:hypothetical protein